MLLATIKKGEPPPPTYAFSHDELIEIVDRWEADASTFDDAAAAVPVSFERQLGLAVREHGRDGFKSLVNDEWDRAGKGLKLVDFRRHIRSGLKLPVTNLEVDRLFESMTGGGGAACASAKEIVTCLSGFAIKAGIPDDRVEKAKAEAARCRDEGARVQGAANALRAAAECEVQLEMSVGSNAPVIAQLGSIVIKRNLKLGEVIAKWGDVDHAAFRKHVSALGVLASDDAIDAVFDQLDDDGGGSLDSNELKVGLKTLMDAAKSNATNTAALEKQAITLRKAAAAQIASVGKQERARAERLRQEGEARAVLEKEREEAEKAEAEKRAEAERVEAERKAAEKAAVAEKLAAARGGGGKAGGAGEHKATENKKVSIAQQNAEERRRAEEQYLAEKKKFKYKGLMQRYTEERRTVRSHPLAPGYGPVMF